MRQNIYSVEQVNQYIKNMFAQDFMLKRIAVRGEVSNCKYHSSGHIYFTLKDAGGTLSAIMFSGSRASGLKFPMKEGDNVVVVGSVRVYERDGKYQLYASEIILEGLGALFRQYEQLKQELLEMGMFDAAYKQPIPKYARRIGVVTAPTGAAVRDIQNISARRNPYVQLILYPALVQGEDAPASIVQGIRTLDQLGVDVMIVGRGGGSIEDLWAFNTEPVARAIFECRTPIISAVGHETDTTIADYVADLRAPTPSAAAELAVFDIQKVYGELDEKKYMLQHGMERCLSQLRTWLEQFELRLRMKSPEQQLRDKMQYCDELCRRLQQAMQDVYRRKRHQLELYASALDGASPLRRLQAGSAFLTDENGVPVSKFSDIQVGDHLQLHMLEGRLTAQVTEKTEIERK